MDLINILNTIRDNASATYQERMPEATLQNLEDIQSLMIDGDNVMIANEFMQTLLNKLVKSTVHTKLFNNPLKSLKKGKVPLGDTIEEIYTNFLKGDSIDPTGATLLNRTLPDTKTVYNRMNYDKQYSVTVDRRQLKQAFASYDNLERYINNVIAQLSNSAELDEYLNIKKLLEIAFEKNAVKKFYVADPLTSAENAKEFITTVKTISNLMCFPSTEYNPYLEAQTTDTKPITTFSNFNEQVLILDVATNTKVNVEVLASLFNMSVADFNETKKIVIDHFPMRGVRAMIIDEAFLQMYDNFMTVTNFFNAKGIYTNYYLTIQQTLAYSILVNAVAFVAGEDVDGDDVVETFNVILNDEGKVSLNSTNKKTTVVEGSRYSTTLTRVGSGGTTVTMNGSTVTGTPDVGTTIASDDGNMTLEVLEHPYSGGTQQKYKLTIKKVSGDITVTATS